MVVNPYLACGHCVACRQGKPNCCVRISVLGVHRDGGMAGLLSLPPGNLIRAEGLTVDDCAAVEFLAIGAHAARRANVVPGEQVLVIGAGPIGLGVAIFARLAGAEVTVLDRDPARVHSALEVGGASHGIVADGDVVQSLRVQTGGDGYGLVFDATGNTASIEAGFDYVAHAGRYVLVSVVRDAISFVDADFHRKEMTLLGSRNALDADFQQVMGALRDGLIATDRIITHRTSLADAARNIPLWARDKAGLIKAVVEL
jgi:2-desacetyl-2-hydroxyethyl bacteriochlorophyllide A dehydrogenase